MTTLLDDLAGKPYTFQEEEPYNSALRYLFNGIIATGADGLYGDLWETLKRDMEVTMESILPESLLEAAEAGLIDLSELGALLMVEWMRM